MDRIVKAVTIRAPRIVCEIVTQLFAHLETRDHLSIFGNGSVGKGVRFGRHERDARS